MTFPPQKPTEHKRYPGEKEITRFEMQRIFEDKEGWVET